MGLAAPSIYVWNGATGAADGSSWTDAITTLQGGLTAAGAGATIAIASDHTEDYASSIILSNGGTAKQYKTIVSLNRADNTFQSMSDGGGVVSATGNFIITPVIYINYIGVNLWAGDDLNLNLSGTVRFYNSLLQCEDNFRFGSSTSDDFIELYDTSIKIHTVGVLYGQSNGRFKWHGGSLLFGASGSLLNNLVFSRTQSALDVQDVDFSAASGASNYLLDVQNRSTDCRFARCKLPGTFGGIVDPANIDTAGPKIYTESCSDVNGIYKFYHADLYGFARDETGIHLDATYDGTNQYSVNITSSASAREWSDPFRFKLTDIFISTTGATLTVELITTDGTTAETLHIDDFWIEVHYPDSTVKSFGRVLSTREALNAGGLSTTALTASAKGAGDWAGELASTNYYKCVADFTTVADEAAGVYTVYVCLAKPSTTVYVCPKITVT